MTQPADDWVDIPSPSSAAPPSLAANDDWVDVAPPPSPGYLDRITNRAIPVAQDFNEAGSRLISGPKDANDENYNPIGDIGEMAGDAFNFYTSPVSAAIQPVAKKVIEKYGDPEKQRDPDAAAERVAGDVTGLLGLALPYAKNIPLPIKDVGTGLPGILGDTAGSDGLPTGARARSSQAKAAQNATAQAAQNTGFAEGVFDNADKAKAAADTIYDQAGSISQGVTRAEPELQKNINKLYNRLSDDPNLSTDPGARGALKILQAAKESFDDSGNIPLNGITFLKRNVNDLYDPKAGPLHGQIYDALNKQVNGAISRARVDSPEWGQIMDAGNDLHVNYKKTFLDNSTSNKYLSAEDKKNYQDSQNSGDPYTAPPDPAVLRRISNLTKISDMQDYNDMLRKLPPELHDQFTQGVLADSSNGKSLLGKVASVYKAAKAATTGNPAAMANVLHGMVSEKIGTPINPALKASYPHIDDAINYHTDLANDAMSRYVAKQPVMQDRQLALPAPAKPLAIAAPESDMVPAPGGPRPMTPQERDAAIALRQGQDARTATGARVDLPNPYEGWQAGLRDRQVGAAEEQRSGSEAAQKAAQTDSMWKSNKGDLPGDISRTLLNADEISKIKGTDPNVIAEALRKAIGSTKATELEAMDQPIRYENSGDVNDLYDFLSKKNGFKHGGLVNENPTEKQKLAGNYKKHHVKWHGLDISIENPKGSERSGTNKDGKEWRSVMPAHYGYFKRSIGADGDHIDCYLGENENSKRVYVIDQKDDSTGKFDEHKIMLNYGDRDEAEKAYRSAFSDKKNRIMKVTRMTIPEFKDWLKNGNTKLPVRRAA